MALAAYTTTWNGEQTPIQTVIQRIRGGTFPDDLVIFHPDFGTIDVNSPGMWGAEYVVSRRGPPIPGMGLTRTFANAPLSRAGLLTYIFDVFTDLETDLGVINRARQKVLRNQLEGAKKLANRAEAAIGKNIPHEIRGHIAQMIGEKPPVKGSNAVLQNFSKINTSLFQGGKKRKGTRKGRKLRKITRRRR